MNLTSHQLDRAVGAVLASAAGDALGSQYEFRTPPGPGDQVEFGVGTFGHAAGEWTDDTSMAMPILQALACGESLLDAEVLGGVVAAWQGWAKNALDVGTQTRMVLRATGTPATEAAARAASERHHERYVKSAGNGSLMRTGPVALGHLGEGEEEALVEAAGRVARLTHWEDDNADASALWSLAIRHAVLTGELDIRGQVRRLPSGRRDRWRELIDDALAPDATPADFAEKNTWVVRAFQGALAAVAHTDDVTGALEAAIRGGNDTDTVAAIAGSLAGALHGGTSVPVPWHLVLHGWPGLRAAGLTRLAVLAARRGKTDSHGWPTADREPVYPQSDTLVRHPHDDGVWLGSIAALDRLATDAPDVDAVVSLCRVGAKQVPEGMISVQVWLIDQDGKNLNLEQTLVGAVQTVSDLRAQGHTVLLHCAEARSRTAAAGVLYGILHRGVDLEAAWADLEPALSHSAPATFLRTAVSAFVGNARI